MPVKDIYKHFILFCLKQHIANKHTPAPHTSQLIEAIHIKYLYVFGLDRNPSKNSLCTFSVVALPAQVGKQAISSSGSPAARQLLWQHTFFVSACSFSFS